MGIKNQKVMSDEEKQILSDNAGKTQEKRVNRRISVVEAEREVFEQEKVNLPMLLETRLQCLANALESVDAIKGLKAPAIYKAISHVGLPNPNRGYTGEELMVLKEAYETIIEKINERVHYVPSIPSFCEFAGITKGTYQNYLVSDDESKRNAASMIDTYISGIMLDSASTRNSSEMMAIFRSKAEHGYVEASTPQVIEYRHAVDTDELKRKIGRITGNVIDADFKEK